MSTDYAAHPKTQTDTTAEQGRVLHRIVRSMHDGQCLRCVHIVPSEQMKTADGWKCPKCQFTISHEEAAEALGQFRPFLNGCVQIFEKWRASRKPEPRKALEFFSHLTINGLQEESAMTHFQFMFGLYKTHAAAAKALNCPDIRHFREAISTELTDIEIAGMATEAFERGMAKAKSIEPNYIGLSFSGTAFTAGKAEVVKSIIQQLKNKGLL